MFKGTTARELAMTVNTGEVIEMVYMGGSKPGAIRKAIVLDVNDEKIRAREVGSRITKEFFISKIIYPIDPNNLPEVQEVEHFESFNDVFKKYETKFQQNGYTPVITGTGLLLFEAFKNGKLRKKESASLLFEEYISEFVIDPETLTEIQITKKRKLPYVVRIGKSKPRSFGSLDNAVSYFVKTTTNPGK